MSIARWNLKEAGGKSSNPRTGTVYQGVEYVGDVAKETKARYCTEKFCVDTGVTLKFHHGLLKDIRLFANMLATVIPSIQNDIGIRDEWIRQIGFLTKDKDIDYELGAKVWNEMLTFGSGPYVTPNRSLEEIRIDLTVL